MRFAQKGKNMIDQTFNNRKSFWSHVPRFLNQEKSDCMEALL